MTSHHHPETESAPSLDELAQLFDGELPPDEAGRVQARLRPQDHATLTDWTQQRDALRALGTQYLDPQLPEPMRMAAEQFQATRRRRSDWARWGGMVATVVLAFGSGRLMRDWQRIAPSASALQAAAPPAQMVFVRQAAMAHTVFAPEVRHPVEVDATQQAHLVQWLSKRLGKPLKVPDLQPVGYELVGGRLLPSNEGARAQFMFQDRNGQRITLYLGAATLATAQTGSDTAAGLPAFAFSQQQAVGSFYWVEDGWGYALSGELPRQKLLELAEVVYRQL